jgi:hypothetical protein
MDSQDARINGRSALPWRVVIGVLASGRQYW